MNVQGTSVSDQTTLHSNNSNMYAIVLNVYNNKRNAFSEHMS